MDDGFRARREMRNTTTIWSKCHLKLCHMYRSWDRPGSEVFFFSNVAYNIRRNIGRN